MSIKYVITFSNQTEHGVEQPEKLYNQSVIEHVTSVLANAAKINNYNSLMQPLGGYKPAQMQSSE